VDMKIKFTLLLQSTYIVRRGWRFLIPHEDKVDASTPTNILFVITPANILFRGGGGF